jgi:DNA-binding transcriptional regulator YhcF (GntR family)
MVVDKPLIEFRLNAHSGVPTYLQLVQQVRQAVRLGLLQPGDQLPTVKEVVGALAINPNTVLKAYRELDHEGLVVARRGQGTFVARTVVPALPSDHAALRAALVRWIERAQVAGFDEDGIAALFEAALHASFREEGVA